MPPVSVRTSSHSTAGSTPHSFPPLEPPMVTEVWAGLRCSPRHRSAGSPPPARGHSFHSTQLAWGPATPPGAQPRPSAAQSRPLQPGHTLSAAPATPLSSPATPPAAPATPVPGFMQSRQSPAVDPISCRTHAWARPGADTVEAEAEAEALAARADRGVLLPGRRWQRAEEQMPGGGPVASGPPW